MTEIHKGLANSTFERPQNIVDATVCMETGLLASNKCTKKYSEIFIKGHLPETCDGHKSQFTICTESGKLANEFCPEDKKETKSETYIVEKERLGLWNTPSIKSTIITAPTEYCTIHKKVEIIEPEPEPEIPEEPEEPEQQPDPKPEDTTDQKPTETPNQSTTTTTPNTTTDNGTSEGNNTGNDGNAGQSQPQT